MRQSIIEYFAHGRALTQEEFVWLVDYASFDKSLVRTAAHSLNKLYDENGLQGVPEWNEIDEFCHDKGRFMENILGGKGLKSPALPKTPRMGDLIPLDTDVNALSSPRGSVMQKHWKGNWGLEELERSPLLCPIEPSRPVTKYTLGAAEDEDEEEEGEVDV